MKIFHLISVIILLISIYVVVSPVDSLYEFWLAGESKGVLDLELNLYLDDGSPYDGPLYIFIHDYTFPGNGSVIWGGLVYAINGKVSGIDVLVNRIVVRSEYNSKLDKFIDRYMLDQLTVIATYPEDGVFGGKSIIFEPREPVTKLSTTIVLKSNPGFRPRVSPKELSWGLSPTRTYIRKLWLKAGEVHRINGLAVTWRADVYPSRTVLYFEEFSREVYYDVFMGSVTYDTGWISDGKAPAESLVGQGLTISSGGWVQKKILARVTYIIEEYILIPPDPQTEVLYYYIMRPRFITDYMLDGYVYGDVYCDHPAPWYADIYSQGEGQQLEITFSEDWLDNSGWMATSVSFSISVGWGTLSFSGSITLYRAAGSTTGSPPRIIVNVINWQSNRLYYWYHNNDPTSYVTHFSWKA